MTDPDRRSKLAGELFELYVTAIAEIIESSRFAASNDVVGKLIEEMTIYDDPVKAELCKSQGRFVLSTARAKLLERIWALAEELDCLEEVSTTHKSMSARL